MINFYNSEVERFQSEKPGSGKDVINRFVNNDPKKISWTRALKADLGRGKLVGIRRGANRFPQCTGHSRGNGYISVED